mgnify:CR=1 FL=1
MISFQLSQWEDYEEEGPSFLSFYTTALSQGVMRKDVGIESLANDLGVPLVSPWLVSSVSSLRVFNPLGELAQHLRR